MIRRALPRLVLLLVLGASACVTTRPAPVPPRPGATETGLASWYGQEYAGRSTANGEIFDPLLLTAAHRTLPFGTVVRVRNPKNGSTVDVRINDRGPFIGERMIDLSYGAAQKIGLVEPGVAVVELTILKVGAGENEPPAPFVVSIPDGGQNAGGPPAVPFPMPSGTKPGSAGTASTSEDFGVEVLEEHGGVVTRRQVGPDGRTIAAVPVDDPAAAGVQRPAPRGTAGKTSQQPVPARTPATSSKGFVVQLGAFQEESNAVNLQRKVAALVPAAYIERRGELYRVRVGPFSTLEEAIDARERLESAGMSGMVVPAGE